MAKKEFWVKTGIGDNWDAGMYEQAAEEAMGFSAWLEMEKAKALSDDSSPYLGLTHLETVMKKRELKAAKLAVPLTAFEECLKVAGIKAFGAITDNVEKFFQFSGTDVLFPDYIANRVYAGAIKRSLVPVFTMGETVISSLNFHKIYIEDTEADRQLGELGLGDEMGETKIIVAKEDIYLKKYGRYLTLAYEDIKYQRLNVFSKALERIGQQIGVDQTDDMFTAIINGDGNSNTPGTTVTSDTTGTIGTADVIEWATCLPTPYKMNKFVGKKALLVEYYTVLADFDNPQATFGYMNLEMPLPYEWDRTVITADRFFGIDQEFSVEHITTGAVLTETEKVIRKQIQGTAISHRDAFAIFDENANAIFDETH
jgi:hypothetical protein